MTEPDKEKIEQDPETREQENAPEGQHAADGGEQFSFLDEHIKERPFDLRKLLSRALIVAILGVVFGLCAYLAFSKVGPAMDGKPSENEVTIPPDEPEQEPGSEEGTVPPEEGEAEAEPVELTEEHYAQMVTAMNQVAAGARRSLVTIIGILDGEDTFNGMYVSPKKASGLIVAETGEDMLILAPDYVLEGTAGYQAAFANGQTYTAELRMDDASFGLAVFAIPLSDISEATRDTTDVAQLGNSYMVAMGEPVILVGRLFGADTAQALGTLSSTGKEQYLEDAHLKLFTSDVGGGSNASGVFVNMAGEVIGFIIPRGADGTGSAIEAYQISDIKNEIENLSNGVAVPYMGVTGIDIYRAEAEEQNLQEGLYVTQVTLDSPAMAAGIQNGDIIYEIEGQRATTLQLLRSVLFSHSEGDEVAVSLYRPGKDGYTTVTCTVTLGANRNNAQ